jgi:branched-chain amino acid transport system substrate-binding protein
VGTEIMLDYAIRQLQKKRIGIVYSTDAAGQSILTTVTRQLAARNMQPAISQALDITATDMSSQALAVKRANAEAVVVQVLGQAGARLAAEFAKLGYRPQILGMSAYNSPRVIQLMGEAGEGLISIAYYHPADSDKPGMQEYRDTMKKYYPDDQLGVEQGLGYSSAAIVVDVLSKIKGDVTSETIVKALEESGPFDQKIAPPVKFAPFTTCGSNPMCRRGQDSAYLVQVKNGKAVPITEFTNVKR